MLDPCEDENDDMQDDGKSIGPDSVHDDQPSDSESEVKKVFICSSALTSYLHSTLLCLKRVMFIVVSRLVKHKKTNSFWLP